MAELITLASAHVVDPRQTPTFTVDSLLLNWKDKRIVIHLGGNGVQRMIEYADLPENPVATNLMVALNKANLSTKSLHKRVLERLVTDGHIAGTIGGTPD